MRVFAAMMVSVLMMACGGNQGGTPKPRAYPRIEFPTGKETTFSMETCPFTFDYMDYSEVVRDTTFFNEAPGHPCWFDISTPTLNGRLHFSYYDLNGEKDMDQLVADAFELTSKHNMKANFIEENAFRKGDDVSGVLFKMEGPVATPYQFFITDSTQHFLRAALYVNAPIKPDSLEPVYDFLGADMELILKTFSWK